ncbi:LysR substrate-binding domain-containing protein [Shewanella gaetbuli]|uniref:LysR substrate-binding domain-containing protein n=1 Tax=Shewanella gaetbuli TaxID=220752 RepID=A0A9X1ZI52_9GAMM|nr:LysR substrate-binding domain-containing protein [Shewanella gaetbuli]MCL1142163.1 LysR substrate-binding domain-containing protein [Shewanella gaetbuli]
MKKHNEFIDKVTFKMLRYFFELANTLHFGKAANNLNITNSPLSSQIKELEAVLGVALVERNSRNVSLTTAGKVLKLECDHIFRSVEHSMQKVKHADRQQSKHIRLGIVSSAFWAGLGEMVKSFNQQYADYEVDIIEMSPRAQKHAILNKDIDIGLVRFADALEIHPLSSTPLTNECFVVAVAQDNPLAQQEITTLSALRNQRFSFMRRENSASAALIINECTQAGFIPEVGKEFIEPTSLMAYVAISQSIAVVASSFTAHQWEGIQFVPLKEKIPASLCAIYDNHSYSDAAQLFIKCISEAQ